MNCAQFLDCFFITNVLVTVSMMVNLVCNVLGWDKSEIDRCGGTVNSYMKESIKLGTSFAFD
jgi:hypothetical protein